MAVGGGSSMFTAAEAFCSVEVFRFGAGQAKGLFWRVVRVGFLGLN